MEIRRDTVVDWQLVAVVALLSLLIGFMPLPRDPDLWFHLADGRYIAANHSVPQADPFSFTRQGRPWVPHSWLFDLGTWLSWQHIGPRGSEAVMAVVFMASALVSFRILTSTGMNPLTAVILCMILTFFSANTRGIRPQVFSLLFCNITLLLLVGHARRPGWRLLLILPPLLLLWSQLHGGAVMGVLVAAVWIAGRLVAAMTSSGHDAAPGRELGIAAAALVLAGLAVLVTPHCMSLYHYLGLTMQLRYLKNNVSEWQAPRLIPPGVPDLCLFLLIAGLVPLLIWRWRQVRWCSLLTCGSLVALALTGIRHIPLACIAAAPLLSEALRPQAAAPVTLAAAPRLRWSWGGLLATCASATVLIACLWRYPSSNADRYAEFEAVAGCDALCRLDRPLRVFTTYNTGCYVLFRGPDTLQVSLDSRADVYGDAVCREVGRVEEGCDWRETFDRWRVDAAVLERTDRLSKILRGEPDWYLLAEEANTRTFLRRQAHPDHAPG